MTCKEIPTERSVIIIVYTYIFLFLPPLLPPFHYSPIMPKSMHIDTLNLYPMHLQSLDHIFTLQSYDTFIYILGLLDLLYWGFSAHFDDV
jgi:hypothetical protein